MERENKEFVFTAELHRLEGKIAWTVFYVPFSVEEVFGTSGRVNIKAVIDGHQFQGTLLPSRNGHYLPFNKAMKDACRKGIGDSVSVVLEPDAELRVVEVPQEIKERLEALPDALTAFEALPAYLRREEINKVMGAKRPETREKRLQSLVEKLV